MKFSTFKSISDFSAMAKIFSNLKIPSDQVQPIESVHFDKHPKRYKKLRLIGWVIQFTFLSVIWVLPLILFPPAAIGTCAFWMILAGLRLAEETKGFHIRGYVVRENDITYKKGLIRFSMTTIPFNRVQHTEINQGPIARAFNLSTLSIYTAGGSTSDLKLSGLDPDTAQRLKDFIAEKSGKHA